MQPRKTFQELLTEGYGVQLPLPAAPGILRNRETYCNRCSQIHRHPVDDICCTHGAFPSPPT